MQEDIAFFAKTNFRNQERVFGIKTDDRRRHMYVIGKTGMGKTNLLENLVIQDIQKGHGVAFIDPHGDTAEKLIKAIPANRINDVIYFNPADQDFPIAFNVMEKVGPEYRHLVASGLVGVFKKIWADSWGPRLEYILRNAILALLEYPGSTLLGVTRILVDKSYRQRVVEKVTDPVVKSFWVDEFSMWNDRVLQEVISPIQNKVGQFLSSALIRNIVGQTDSSFDVREAMDNRKILIMNLSKGRLGEDNSALLGAMMITKIQLAAMGRVDIPEEERADFYLYVDEFQNFATESFANILSEARKYHLNLVLANQYVTQIDEKVRDAIFGNAGTIISFRVGATDAEFLEKEFDPIFLMNDIVNLPKYHIYLKLMIDGIAGDAFSAVSLAPIRIDHTAINEEKVIRISRERYAANKIEVEDKIRRWSGLLTDEEKAALYTNGTPPVSRNAAPSYSSPATQRSYTPAKTPARAEYTSPAARPQVASRPGPDHVYKREAHRNPGTERAPVETRPRSESEVVQRTQVASPVVREKIASSHVASPVIQVSAPLKTEPARSAQFVILPETQTKEREASEAHAVSDHGRNVARKDSIEARRVDEPVSVPERVLDTGAVLSQTSPVVPLNEEQSVASSGTLAFTESPLEHVKQSEVPERTMYAAQCATCDIAITVPFKPEPSRPTFCKDCLKDYQRATARARRDINARESVREESARTVTRPQSHSSKSGQGQHTRAVRYVSQEAPMSLAQIQHIQPKSFKPLRKKVDVNLADVRSMIHTIRTSDV